MFEYFVYGHKLISNIRLHILESFNGQTTIDFIIFTVHIDKSIKYNSNRTIETFFDDNKCILTLGNKTTYIIEPFKNRIKVITSDFIWMESTFLNLPFAIFFALKNMLLLHASTLIDYNNIAIPLCANKGVGKTTTSIGLSNFFDFYSDDTLLINLENNKLNCYFGTKFIKLNKDTFSLMNSNKKFENFKKNIQGKAYYNFGKEIKEISGAYINKLYFLKREWGETRMDTISHPFKKKMYLHINICGTSTLGYEYCKIIVKNIVFDYIISNVEFFKLTLKDDLKYFGETIKSAKRLIDNTIN